MAHTIQTERKKGSSDRDFYSSKIGPKLEIIDLVNKKNACYIAAIRKDSPEEVIAIIVEYTWMANNYYRENFRCQFFFETDRTFAQARKCPESILKLLSPPELVYPIGSADYTNAVGWRNACYKNLQRKKSQTKAHRGDLIEFTNEIVFVGGDRHRILKFVNYSSFVKPESDLPESIAWSDYRISNWRDLDYSIISETEAKKKLKSQSDQS